MNVSIIFTLFLLLTNSSFAWHHQQNSQSQPHAPSSDPPICPFFNAEEVEYVYDMADTSTLVAVNLVFRHGGRAPSQSNFFSTDIYNDTSYWPNGAGQLTYKGQVMASELGTYIRNRYDGFLAKYYSPGEVFVQSSDVQRAIDTANFMLGNLYPNAKIPVKQINQKIDNKLQFKANCPTYTQANSDFLKSSDDIDTLYKDNPDLFDQLTAKTGMNVTGFAQIYQIADTLWAECQNGYFHDWAAEFFPAKTQPFHNLNFISWTATPQMQRLEAGPLIYEMIQNFRLSVGLLDSPTQTNYTNDFQNVTIEKSKMYVYSAHDPTISALLNSLGLYGSFEDAMYSSPTEFSVNDGITPVPPLYTSQFIFELHCRSDACKPSARNYWKLQRPAKESDYEVNVYLKPRKDVPLLQVFFEECGKDGQCNLEEFQYVYDNLIIDNTEWQQECGLSGY